MSEKDKDRRPDMNRMDSSRPDMSGSENRRPDMSKTDNSRTFYRRNRGHRGPNAPVEKAKDFKGTVGKLMRSLREYYIQFIIVFIFAAASAGFSIVGPKILGGATTVLFEGLMAKIRGTGSIPFDSIGHILMIVMLIYIISSAFGGIQGWIMAGVSTKIAYRFRRDISVKINKMPMKYFEKESVGDVLSRITNDVDTLGQSLNQSLTQLVTSVTTLVGVVIMMLTISPLMTLICLMTLPVSLAVIMFIVSKSQRHFRDQQKYLGEVNGTVEEIFSGQNIVKAFNQEEQVKEAFEKTNEKLYKAAWHSQFLSGSMQPVMQFISDVAYVFLAISGAALAIRGVIKVGDIQAFIQYVKNFTQPIMQLSQVFNMLQSMVAAAERVYEFLEEEEETEDPAVQAYDHVNAQGPQTGGAQRAQAVGIQGTQPGGQHPQTSKPAPIPVVENIRGAVEFRNITFGYDPDKEIIHGFSCKVEPGQTVVIVGPTGAGKTTLVKLLMRFYDVDSGSILLDGTDIRCFSRKDLREQFGMVLQDTWLFKGSIRENIRYGKLEASDEEVVKAAKAAHADRFIRTLPGGYDMELNEEADNVSQGQKQLLTIARAILADRRILILDEATSSVDTMTETRIQKGMDNLMKGRTSFVIAHRLSTIKNADMILVINEGNIVEQGTHNELLRHGGFYADLYNSQFEE